MTIKPPFPWNGAKTRILKDLMPFIEQWDGKGKWIEPFLGTGIVSRQIAETYPDSQQILGDLNPWLIAAHQYWLNGTVEPPTLTDVSPEKVRLYRNLQDNEFNSVSERDQALRFLVCLYSAWGNRWQTNEDGTFATPINTARNGGDPRFLLRRLEESYGTGWGKHSYQHGNWLLTAQQATKGDFVYLDSPYPETAGYGTTKWDLEDWSLMYDWVKTVAIPNEVFVLVSNPGTMHLLWDYLMKESIKIDMPSQGRSTRPRVEYIGFWKP